MAAFHEIVIRRPGEADFVFCGRLIAEASISPLQEGHKSRDPFDPPEWTRIRIYELADGRFVAIGEEYADLRCIRRELRICADGKQVVSLLGYGDLAKAAYALAEIDANERPRPPEEGSERASESAKKKTEARCEAEAAPAEEPSGPRMKVVARELLKKRIAVAKDSNYRRQLSALERLRDAGVERALAQVEPESIAKLAELQERFPNLAEVLLYFRRQLSLCLLSRDRILRIPPVLLVGPAGVGKTRLVQAIAISLGGEFHVVSCGTVTANFVLAGADAQWSEAKPGKIFEALCTGRTGNPIVLLDEIDKMSGERRYDPYGPLYALLEPTTAAKFFDECLGLEMDCSHIVWIASANDADALPEPIMSRLTRFDVRAPKREEMMAIAASVYRDLLEGEPWGPAFQPELSSAAIDELSSLTPRQLRQTLLRAAACVAERIPPDSVSDERPLEISAKDIADALPRVTRRRVGFRAA